MQRLFVKRNDPLYKSAIYYMEYIWGTKGIFPGSQPVSIERKHFDILRSQPYVVCEKTDGVRCMLIAFMYEGKKTCICVNRALDMFVCPLNFRKSVYGHYGTIIEGELYNDDTIMIYDVIAANGIYVGHLDFLARLEHAEKLLKLLTVLKYDCVTLKIKTFHLLSDFKTFMNDYLPTVTQDMDGIVITPVNTPVKSGTHETMFKWKPRVKNTIDFQMKRLNDKWNLYVQNRGKLIFESILSLKQVPPWVTEDSIVECQYMIEDEPMWWKPIKLRNDKTFPNGRRTFYRTLVNIREDIKLEEFLFCT